jgi:glycosyltransferase involved in cell wall biosynthesis
MNKTHDIVMIGSEEWWEAMGICPRGASLARAFSRSEEISKVFLINCPRSVPGRVKAYFSQERRLDKIYPVILRGRGYSVLRVNPKLLILNTTVMLPENLDSFSRFFGRRALASSLESIIGKFGFNEYVAWILNPRVVDIAQSLKPRLTVFDTVDNLLVHDQTKRFKDKIANAYKWAESKADLVCILSEGQRSMFSDTSRLYLLPNGVDAAHFNAPHAVPDDMKNIKRPVMMYVGVLQEKVDVELAAAVADQLKDSTFIFIGPDVSQRHFDSIKRRPNVRLIGPRRYDLVPSYINCADVCIIPHAINDLTRFMDPLKIYEYLACGKPVVSTPVACTEKFKQYLYIAEDAHSFANAIKTAISENSETLEKERRSIAAQNSWDARVNSAIAKINFMLTKRTEY